MNVFDLMNQKKVEDIRKYTLPLAVKGTRGGVQHGVWTRLHSFMIIRESIDITMLKLWFSKNS